MRGLEPQNQAETSIRRHVDSEEQTGVPDPHEDHRADRRLRAAAGHRPVPAIQRLLWLSAEESWRQRRFH